MHLDWLKDTSSETNMDYDQKVSSKMTKQCRNYGHCLNNTLWIYQERPVLSVEPMIDLEHTQQNVERILGSTNERRFSVLSSSQG